jgi:hypothetical protein
MTFYDYHIEERKGGRTIMDNFLDFLSKGWVGSFLGLIGLISGYIFYRRSLREPRLVYQSNAVKLIGKDESLPEEIDILYKGKSVSRLTRTYIIFWNSGKATIDGRNIVDEDPLRLELKDGEFLTKRIISSTRDVNNFKIYTKEDEPNKLFFTFDFLDSDDGVVIELLHSASESYPVIKGTIRGIPKGILDWGRLLSPAAIKSRIPYLLRRKYLTVTFVLGIFLLLGSILLPTRILTIGNSEHSIRWIWGFSGVLYCVLPLAVWWFGRRRFPKSLIVDELNE